MSILDRQDDNLDAMVESSKVFLDMLKKIYDEMLLKCQTYQDQEMKAHLFDIKVNFVGEDGLQYDTTMFTFDFFPYRPQSAVLPYIGQLFVSAAKFRNKPLSDAHFIKTIY